MENKIQLLSPEVIGQIAAGEVVERPSAAIKELVENSLDAGATAITVDIKDGGLTSFRVTDNGKGIPGNEVRMAFERHATSKIRTAKDLFAVETLGFRGEALASIAAVSHVQCTTRVKGTDMGISVRNDGGIITDMRDAACPEGTSFVVKDLFYNAPVRKKFLKKASAETSMISDLMARMILSRPDISFRYLADGKTVFFSAGDGKLESAVLSIYGMEVLRLLTHVSGNMNGVVVNGFVGVGDVSRGNRSYETFFLNHRAMKSALLSNAVEEACRQRVTIGRFPMCILNLTMPFEAADVNVHPNKWEVRFQNEKGVHDAILTITQEALRENQRDALTAPRLFDREAETKPAAQIKVTQTVPADGVRDEIKNNLAGLVPIPAAPIKITPPAVSAFHESGGLLNANDYLSATRDHAPPVQIQEKAVEDQYRVTPRVIGVLFDTYILLEYRDQLILCDQHAAHERLLYEKLIRETGTEPASQTLLLPQAVKLTRQQYQTYEDYQTELRNAGFDISPFGDDTVQLRGVPIVLGQPQANQCLTDALDDLRESGTTDALDRTHRIMQMACKHAVKGGEKLPLDEIAHLIDQVLNNDIPPTCPHGRPLMVTLSHTELDKRFRRIQNG